MAFTILTLIAKDWCNDERERMKSGEEEQPEEVHSFIYILNKMELAVEAAWEKNKFD